ncbi:MAG TPA: DEAD/DEAH box helicase [Thermoplasmata archaeon]|nr:DEAD/DEAH box helicase [Thermoplasmata archaeon]
MPDESTKPESEQSSFDELELHPTLKKGIREMGYQSPTPIQSRAIPAALTGRDMIGTAQTGTGKTAAFLLPILERLMNGPRGRIRALILTPTRELAVQAEGFLRALGRHTGIRGAAVYGGVGMQDQERALRGGAEVIVATPGRLLDHMSRGYVDLRPVEIAVLDEGDRMLDMGFLPDVRRILGELPRDRQTLLFSATMPPEIVRLAQEFLREPKTVQVGPTTAVAVGVSHLALPVSSHRKAALLREVLRDETMTSVLVFMRTKHRAERLARDLARAGLSASAIHGDRSQSQRTRALEGFRTGQLRILVATDLASRGIDVEGVSHVVNFDVPHEPDIYIHRVGRTARAERRGDAYTFVSPEEEDDFHRIEQLLGLQIRRGSVPGFDYSAPPPPRDVGVAARGRGAPGGGDPGRFRGGGGRGGPRRDNWRERRGGRPRYRPRGQR